LHLLPVELLEVWQEQLGQCLVLELLKRVN
jgi:hypothetical protein